MSKPSMFRAVVALAIVCVFISGTSASIANLNDANFDSFVGSKELLLVKFYAPWCPHSKALAPIYDELEAKYGKRLYFAQVDGTENPEVSKQYNVNFYPTVLIFRRGTYNEYIGVRSLERLSAAIERELLPLTTALRTTEKAKTFVNSDEAVVIGYFTSIESEEYRLFSEAASNYRHEVRFGYFLDGSVANSLGLKHPGSIALFKKFDESRLDLDKALTADNLDFFINTYTIPALDQLHPEAYRYYLDGGLPLVFLFLDPTDKITDQVIHYTRNVANKHRGKLIFTWIDIAEHELFAESLGFGQPSHLSLAILDDRRNKKYLMKSGKQLTGDAISKWITDYLAGDLMPFLRSQPVPKQKDGFVEIAVSSTYRDMVNDPNADVFIEFYAPWCNHCKNLVPVWRDLAYLYRHVPSIRIAKIDGTANDVDGLDIRLYPTLLFYPATNKTNILEFTGERTFENFVTFLENTASIPFDTSIYSDEE